MPDYATVIERVSGGTVSVWGSEFEIIAFRVRERLTEVEHLVLLRRPMERQVPRVRLHSACIIGDVFSAAICDCREQLELAGRVVGSEGGAILYLANQEGQASGLIAKCRAAARGLRVNGALGRPPDVREYAGATAILRDLGLLRIALMTSNQGKIDAVRGGGIEVVDVLADARLTKYDSRRF